MDYKGGGHSNLVLSEFHHIVGTAFFIFLMIFYFSGTGNSKWIALQLSKVQNEQLVFIPDALHKLDFQYYIADNEKIGFIFPIYSWGVPPIVLQFIQRLTFLNYYNQYLFFVCSCGDDIGLAHRMFCNAVKKKSWECNAGFSVIMPNNYVLLPGFDIDSKELEKYKLQEAIDRVAEINHAIEEKKALFNCNKGKFPFIKTKIINPLFVRKGIVTSKFFTTDDCISCKRCEMFCPVGNIVLVDCKPVWGDNCTSCLACYHICPKHAVQYGKQTLKKGQYFNPNRI